MVEIEDKNSLFIPIANDEMIEDLRNIGKIKGVSIHIFRWAEEVKLAKIEWEEDKEEEAKTLIRTIQFKYNIDINKYLSMICEREMNKSVKVKSDGNTITLYNHEINWLVTDQVLKQIRGYNNNGS